MSPTSPAVCGAGRNAKVITSVAPACPRWARLSRAMVRRDTKATETMASRTRSARRTRSTRARARVALIGMRTACDATTTDTMN